MQKPLLLLFATSMTILAGTIVAFEEPEVEDDISTRLMGECTVCESIMLYLEGMDKRTPMGETAKSSLRRGNERLRTVTARAYEILDGTCATLQRHLEAKARKWTMRYCADIVDTMEPTLIAFLQQLQLSAEEGAPKVRVTKEEVCRSHCKIRDDFRRSASKLKDAIPQTAAAPWAQLLSFWSTLKAKPIQAGTPIVLAICVVAVVEYRLLRWIKRRWKP